jgi:protein-S-isoprenylcysteine O-methyltransferase Ste14
MSPSSDDLRSGLIFIVIAVLFALTASRTLDIGTASLMGPGFFPIMISAALAILGIAIIVTSVKDPNKEKRRPVSWRGIFFVIAAPVLFGLLVRTLGLVPALLAAVTCSVLASRKIDLKKGVLIVLGLTAFCIAVFSYGIGLTAQLFIWPPQSF